MDDSILEHLLRSRQLDVSAAGVIRDLVARGKTLRQAAVGGRYVSTRAFTEATERSGVSVDEPPRSAVRDVAPTWRIVAVLLRQAVDGGVSDIHIEPIQGETRVRFRVDGVLRTSLRFPLHAHPALALRLKTRAGLDPQNTRSAQRGGFTEQIRGRSFTIRVATVPLLDGESIVLRLQDAVRETSLEELGYRKLHVESMMRAIEKPAGISFIIGPTGSGRSTTLLAGLNALHKKGRRIAVLDQADEHDIPVVNRRVVRPDMGETHITGLHELLREDAEAVALDDIPDRETAEAVTHAALCGRHVYAMMRANDVPHLISRLFEMGIEPFLLASTLNAIAVQRLVRTSCPHCKVPEEIAAERLEAVRNELKQIPKRYLPGTVDLREPVFYRGQGCARCGNSGYAGRTAVAEIFHMTPEAKRLMEQGFSAEKMEAEANRQGMLRLRQDALLKALEGVTPLENFA